MANYKIIFDGEEEDDIFKTYEEAEEYALYLISCHNLGGEMLGLSNPGDYPYDSDGDDPEYEIIETDEEIEEPDEHMKMFLKILHNPGVFDDRGEYVRCPNCGHGLHYYNGVKACPECGPIE